ncbi:YfzA family protein [Paenibacillus faecalis]|uniref:YfzA family protein n=1 Tax=Paenibacillus faecalis TaxID=2079532 RepID=UPI001F19AF8F|nr:YfzA family protein [Paenibacillus faecalis]
MTVNRRLFFKRSWVLSIGSFLLLQFIFIMFESTGWMPNLREMDGTLFGRIAESTFFREWFSFYETPYFNLCTVFFGTVLLAHGIVGASKKLMTDQMEKRWRAGAPE